MMYDLAEAPPQPGSLLESVFRIVSKRRQEAQFYQTKAIIAAVLTTASDNTKTLEEALDDYKNALFPFLEGEKAKETAVAKDALRQWAERVAFKVKPLWRANEQKGFISRLRKGAERVKRLEEGRRRTRHRRI